jgi:hypothetical protein
MPASVEPAATEPHAPTPAGIEGAPVTITIVGGRELAPADTDGSIARKGLQVRTAAPTTPSRMDQPRPRAFMAPGAL